MQLKGDTLGNNSGFGYILQLECKFHWEKASIDGKQNHRINTFPVSSVTNRKY
jgi:hypothetical protein